jgi:hypothetical protein
MFTYFIAKVAGVKMEKHEMNALMYFIAGFIILSLLEAVVYIGFPAMSKYVIWLLYLNITIAALGTALWHFFAHKAVINCMLGMMIGMTFAMQTGMMLGAIISATNGFFVGAMVGMLISVGIGILTGKCCGIMGIMQGMMAGVMGGTMGPMITLMMFSDHLNIFMPVYMAVNLAIIAGGSYMIYKELKAQQPELKPASFAVFIALCVIASFAIALIMIFGPKSLLVR